MPKDPKGTHDGPSAVELLQEKLKKVDPKNLGADYVKLAQVHKKGSSSDPDWDPLEHPKDAEGKFTDKHAATFVKKGHAKQAKYVTNPLPAGKVTTPEDPDLEALLPGESLYSFKPPSAKVPFKVRVLVDGSMSYKTPQGSWQSLSVTSFAGQAVLAGKATLLGSKPSAEDKTAHPTIDQTIFTHPVSGIKWALEPGEKLYQHKTSPNSFLLMDKGEQTGSFFNKHGKLIASNPSTKVWTPKNYNLIWPASETTASPAQTDEVKKAALADLKKAKEQAAKEQATLAAFKKAEEQAKESLAALDAFNKKNAVDEGPLAEWEKELLQVAEDAKTPKTVKAANGSDVQMLPGEELWSFGDSTVKIKPDGSVFWVEADGTFSVKSMSETAANIKLASPFSLWATYDGSYTPPKDEIYTLDSGIQIELAPGETVYEYQNHQYWVHDKPNGVSVLYSSGANKPEPQSGPWWSTQKSSHSENWTPVAGAGLTSLPTLEVLTGEGDGPWGSVQNPAGGKIELLPGDTVYFHPMSGKIGVSTTKNGNAVGGLVYSKDGSAAATGSTFLKWTKVTTVPVADVQLKPGKVLESAPDADFTQKAMSILGKALGMKPDTSENFLKAYDSPTVLQQSANMAATLKGVADLQNFEKYFLLQQEISELASLLVDPASDREQVENRWAHVQITGFNDVPYGAPGSSKARQNLQQAVENWRYEQKVLQAVGAPSTQVTQEALQAHLQSKGFSASGGLTKDEALQWLKADLGALSSPEESQTVKKALQHSAEFKVLSAQAEMFLKKSQKPALAPPPSTEVSKALAAQQAAFQKQLKKLPVAFVNASEVKYLYYQTEDLWSEYDAEGFIQSLTTADVIKKVSAVGAAKTWKPQGNTIEGKTPYADRLIAWESEYGPLEQAEKKVLNSYLKANGGNYVALMKAEHKRDWVKLHLAGDEVGKWDLEYKLAVGTYKEHKWEDTHPGSWGSSSGAAARQATSDFLVSQSWASPALKEQLGKSDPSWDAALNDLSVSEIKEAFTALSLDVQYGWSKEYTTGRREALQWWLESRGRLPEPSFKAPIELAPPAPVAMDVPVPAGVTQQAWTLVLAAEQGSTDILKLPKSPNASSKVFKAENYGLTSALTPFVPVGVQHLLNWSVVSPEDMPSAPLIDAKKDVAKAVKERAKQGVWIPPDYVVWKDKKGNTHPLPPGASLYSDSNGTGTFYVVNADEQGGYYVDDAGWSSAFSESTVSAVTSQPLVMKGPKPLTYGDASELKVSPFIWDSVAEIENKPVSEVQFAGLSMESTNTPNLIAAIKNSAPAHPYVNTNPDKLPDGVKLMVVDAILHSNKAVLDTVEFKLKKGHYAQVQSKKVLDPKANYYQHLLKGNTSAASMGYSWSAKDLEEVSTALGISFTKSYGMADLQTIEKALQPALNPEPPTLPQVGSTPGLPQDLQLSKINKSLGGMHSKQAWVDQQGNEWMSKSFKSDENAGARIDSEHIANRIGLLIGGRNPETRTMQLDGVYQYVQYLKPANGDFSGKSPSSLSNETLAQAMEEHVTDWLTANHDSHPMNLLMDPNGVDVIGIDKGQAWRFFGEDKLAVGYLPPSNPVPVWYDQFYYAVQGAQIDKEKLDFVARRVLIRAYKASTKWDDEVRALLGEAFDKRHDYNIYSNKQDLIDGVMQRKAALLTDFENFYKKLYKQGGYTWDIDVDQLVKSKIDDHTHVAVTPEFMADVKKAGVHGKALLVNSADLDDSHIMVYTEVENGKTTLAGQTFVQQSGDKKLTSWLKSQLIEGDTTSFEPTYDSTDYSIQSAASDLPLNSEWFSAIKAGAITVNHHHADKEYNQSTLEQLEQTKSSIAQHLTLLEAWEQDYPEKPFSKGGVTLKTAEQQAAWKAMILKYTEDIARVQKAHKEGDKVFPHVTVANYSPTAKLNMTGEPTIKVSLIADSGGQIDVWDDLNYVYTLKDVKKKITANEYKVLIAGDTWRAKTPKGQAASEVSGDETWTYHSPSGDDITWVKKAGTKTWKTAGGVEADDEALQKSIADNPTQYTFTGPAVDETAEVTVGKKVLKVYKRKAYASDGHLDMNSGVLNVKGKSSLGQSGYQYDVESGDVTIQYRPWTEPGVLTSQRGMLRFKVKNWEGTTEQLMEVMETLREMGLSLKDADEQSLQLAYWRHLYDILQDRADRTNDKYGKVKTSLTAAKKANPKMSEADELKALQTAWGSALGDSVVLSADWKPKFSRMQVHTHSSDPSFTSGHPHWVRPDYNLADVKTQYNTTLPMSSVSASHKLDEIVMSGGMLSTEERLRVLGQWVTGMSSSEDQTKGSAHYVFSRQGQTAHVGEIYYHPKVALRTTNYAFSEDKYGNINSRKTSAYFGHTTALSYDYGGNEMMIKDALSFLDDVAVVKFSSSDLREKALKKYKALGITTIHGLPIAEVFVLQSADVSKTIKKIWDIALQEAKA